MGRGVTHRGNNRPQIDLNFLVADPPITLYLSSFCQLPSSFAFCDANSSSVKIPASRSSASFFSSSAMPEVAAGGGAEMVGEGTGSVVQGEVGFNCAG